MTGYRIHLLLFYLTGVGKKPLMSSNWVETNAHRKPVPSWDLTALCQSALALTFLT